MQTGALDKFLNEYDPSLIGRCAVTRASALDSFFSELGGRSFGNGLYRTHTGASSEHWSDMMTSVFSDLGLKCRCFGYDWTGRQFALDITAGSATAGLVLMFEVDIPDVYSTKQGLLEFHNTETVDYPAELLRAVEFETWSAIAGAPSLQLSECAGLKVPLFLSGVDTPEMRERIDMDVYWTFTSQLWAQTKNLEEGTIISGITVDGRIP